MQYNADTLTEISKKGKAGKVMKSQVARELTGLTDAQLHNADFRTSRSSEDIDIRNARQSVRLSSGMVVCPEDQNELRKELRKPPRCFE